jgi:hypothetical protein
MLIGRFILTLSIYSCRVCALSTKTLLVFHCCLRYIITLTTYSLFFIIILVASFSLGDERASCLLLLARARLLLASKQKSLNWWMGCIMADWSLLLLGHFLSKNAQGSSLLLRPPARSSRRKLNIVVSSSVDDDEWLAALRFALV